jgi:hypothetical protein
MKISPNFQDSNQIKTMYAAGKSVDEISRRVKVEAGAVQRHIDTCGQFDKKEPEMSPQMRGAITRKENAAKAAFDDLSAADPEPASIPMEYDHADQES